MNAISQRFTTIHTVLATQHLPSTSFWAGIFTWAYWSDPYVGDFSPYALFFGVIVILVIAGLLYWRMAIKRLHQQLPLYQPLLLNIPSLIGVLIISAPIYLFARAVELPYFNSRFFMLAIIAITIGWIAFLIYYMLHVIPAKQRLHLEKERFLRYIPKKKAR